MTTASAFNPISPSLILLSGVGASFGLNWGLLLALRLAIGDAHNGTLGKDSAPVSLPWLASALILAALFVGVLGPGIRFSD